MLDRGLAELYNVILICRKWGDANESFLLSKIGTRPLMLNS
jgi:hypothetical protein